MSDRPQRLIPNVVAIATAWLATMAVVGGCTLAPRKFGEVNSPAPIVRARALTLGDDRPDHEVLPILLKSLDDADPVVRMTANEELKRRTGKDFGFLPWADPAERSLARQRWHAWLARPSSAPQAVRPTPQAALQQAPGSPMSLPADVGAGAASASAQAPFGGADR